MIDMMDIGSKNKTMLLSNLSFDHSLLDSEINDLINLLSSNVAVAQIYFKGDIDIASIEKVKLLLEGLPNIDDSMIEKYIIKNIDSEEKMQLNSMVFSNIDTWNIAYSIKENRFSITSLPKYRLVDEWFLNIIKKMDEDLSVMEKVSYLYDKVKMFEFDPKIKYGRLPEILYEEKANSYGYNLVFKELLSMCGISSKIECYEIDGEQNYLTMAMLDDEKYGVTGIYFFEPSSDTISKNQYKNNLARRMNYNFFGVAKEKLKNLSGQVKPLGLLKILMMDGKDQYNHCLNIYKRKHDNSDIDLLENTFKMSLDNFYLKACNTASINVETLFTIISGRVSSFSKDSDDKVLLENTIMENYMDREKELFLETGNKKKTKIAS